MPISVLELICMWYFTNPQNNKEIEKKNSYQKYTNRQIIKCQECCVLHCVLLENIKKLKLHVLVSQVGGGGRVYIKIAW